MDAGIKRERLQQMVEWSLCPIDDWPLLAKHRTAGPHALFMRITSALTGPPHLWAWPLQMLLNCIKVLVTPIEATTAGGSQYGLFMIYKSALLFTSGGCLGKNLIWVSDEQIAPLSSEISLEMSNDTIFLWWFQPPPTRQHKQIPNTTFFLVLSAAIWQNKKK